MMSIQYLFQTKFGHPPQNILYSVMAHMYLVLIVNNFSIKTKTTYMDKNKL